MILVLRGELEAGDKEFEPLNLDVRKGFIPLFYGSFWKHDYAECRRLLDQAAKYPELENDRWDTEVQLIFLTKGPFDEAAALETEKRLEAAPGLDRKATPARRNEHSSIASRCSSAERRGASCFTREIGQEHPVSEDAVDNTGRVNSLAVMYLLAGERERALETMARLVQLPGGLWYGPLKIDPIYDELRKDPGSTVS